MSISEVPATKPTVVIDPRTVTIRSDPHGGVTVRMADGTTFYQARLVEALPIMRRRKFVVVYDPESEQVARTVLDRSYFLSRITSIQRIRERYGVATWYVTTDRGPRVFEVRSRSESVWWLGASRILIKDPDGNRYEIRDLNKLDSRSRILAELHV
jgi:hypothetical protein